MGCSCYLNLTGMIKIVPMAGIKKYINHRNRLPPSIDLKHLTFKVIAQRVNRSELSNHELNSNDTFQFHSRVPSNRVAMVSRNVFCGASNPFLCGILFRSLIHVEGSLWLSPNWRGCGLKDYSQCTKFHINQQSDRHYVNACVNMAGTWCIPATKA